MLSRKKHFELQMNSKTSLITKPKPKSMPFDFNTSSLSDGRGRQSSFFSSYI